MTAGPDGLAARVVPFKGLSPYGERDAEFFFSRDAEREVILGNLMAARLLLLYGPTGVGKSSLLHAGVANALHRIALSNLESTGAPELAVVVLDTWKDDPATTLKERLAVAVREARAGETEGIPSPDLSLRDFVAAAAELIQGELFIILDQFEEYFLYHGKDEAEGSFFTELPRVVSDLSLPAHCLLSLREDALAELDLFKAAIPNLFANRFRLDYLDRAAARLAITKPVEMYNRLHPGEEVSVEEGLINQVLTDVQIGHVDFADTGQAGREAAGGRIATPYLQLVMRRLWDQETSDGSRVLHLATLQDPEKGFGGVKEIVRAHLDEKLSVLSPGEQKVAAEIFRYLVTRSSTKYAYSIQDLAELQQVGSSADEISAVVTALSRGDTRILRNIGPPIGASGHGEDRYQIFHDVLAPAILDWRRRYARREERMEIRREEEQRLEAKRNRMLRWVIVVVSAAALLMTATAIFALLKRKQAEAARAEAEKARGDAVSALATAQTTLGWLQNSATRRTQESEAFADFFRAVAAENPALARRSLAAVDSSVARVVALDTVESAVTASIPVVYIQFSGSVSRATIEALRYSLNGSGFAAPGTERIASEFGSAVRYFHEGDAGAARAVAQKAEAFFRGRGCPVTLPVRRIPLAARPGQLEVWVSINCPG